MDETTYIQNLITAQIVTLRDGARSSLPAEHPIVKALDNCLLQIELADKTAVNLHNQITAGMASGDGSVIDDDYFEGLRDRIGNEDDDYEDLVITPENVEDREDNVLGVIPNGDGTYTTIGDVEDAGREAEAMVVDYIAETGKDVNTDDTFTVTYTRLNGEALSVSDVQRIVDHPVSAPLKNLGEIQLYSVNDGSDTNEKVAVFAVLEKGDLPLEAFAVNIMGYKGIQVFPGLGQVQAVGNVTTI